MQPTHALSYLVFERSEATDGVTALEAMATTAAEHHEAVLAEASQVLDWARAHFPDTQGAVDEGMDWDHDLQVSIEDDGRWYTVTLTLTGSPRFVDAFQATFS